MRSAVALFVALMVVLASVTTARPARAELPVVKAWVDATAVEIGQPFALHLSASSTSDAPQSPDAGAPPRFKVQGIQTMPTRTVSIVNGVRKDSVGLEVTWSVVPTALGVGVFSPSVVVNGKRGAVQVTVNVVPHGQAPQPRGNQGFPGLPGFPDPFAGPQGGSPLDPWSALLGNPMSDDDDGLPNVRTDPKLALETARSRGAFLHAVVDKASAVVGEQVTLSIYLYVDTGVREPDFNDVHEASCPDFLKRQLLDDNATLKSVGYARAGGRIWTVKVIRRFALFPIKSGDLHIGPMSLGVVGPMGGATNLRDSEALDVHVTEPPMAGRPPGYMVGDVGTFKLEAHVEPHNVDRGGAVSVVLDLSGVGNLPANITPPARRGLEWLTPEIHEQIGNVGQDRWGGKRTFAYVLHAKSAGLVDLGSIRLPYWDPTTRAYAVAEADLGSLDVSANGAADEDAGAANDPLPGLPEPRAVRSPPAVSRPHYADTPYFWLALTASPLAFLAFAGGSAAARRLRALARTRRESPTAELARHIDAAEEACRGEDAARAEQAVARALETAAKVKTGVAIRGVTSREAARRLVEAGVAEETADEIAKILTEGEEARFSASSLAGDDARARWKRAKSVIAHLGVTLSLLLAVLLAPRAAHADELDDLFARGRDALAAGRPADAITDFEALADRGVVDANVSFDRGLAYAERVRLGGEQTGDLGRAAHGFEEARGLTRDAKLEADATRALETVRAEVARRRARAGASVDLEQSSSLGESIVHLLPEDVWALLALIASVATGLALFLRGRVKRPRLRVAATIVVAVAAPLTLACAGITRAAAVERATRVDGVIVSPTARPSDARGIALPRTDPLPEGARVRVLSAEGTPWTEVRWGALDAWVPAGAVRRLSRTP